MFEIQSMLEDALAGYEGEADVVSCFMFEGKNTVVTFPYYECGFSARELNVAVATMALSLASEMSAGMCSGMYRDLRQGEKKEG